MKKRLLSLFMIAVMMFALVSTTAFAYNSASEKISLDEAKRLATEYYKSKYPLTDETINFFVNDFGWNRKEFIAKYGSVTEIVDETDEGYVFVLFGGDAGDMYAVNKFSGRVTHIFGHFQDDYGIYLGGLKYYEDKYLYYYSERYADITGSFQDLIICDIAEDKEICYIADVAEIEVAGGYIFTLPYSGMLYPLPLTRHNPDGSNPQIISNEARDIRVYNNNVYYSALNTNNDYSNYSMQIRKYNPQTGTTANLTDYCYGYVKEIYNDHAVFADANSKETIVRYNDEIKIIINNNRLSFDQLPIIIDGRTLVPLRAIFEALGATVDWDGNTQTVTATRDNKVIKITIGDNKLYVNNNVTVLDVPAQIVNNRTLVPVRAVSEAFGCNVDWDGNTQTVYINSK
ncbi:MAG: hypothetical protein IJH37_11650 [Clostridia bacterium]|nr:hypothetical protein [Clostridia bacterium]